MYRIFIIIEPDGDFSYENNIEGFDKDLAEVDLYFNNRDNITTFLKQFYSNVCKTITTSKNYITDTVKEIKESEKYVDMIVGMFEYFHIKLEYGNQYIYIEVLPANPKEIKLQDSEECITIYDKSEEKFWSEYPHFNSYNLEEDWDWDKIKCSEKLWK